MGHQFFNIKIKGRGKTGEYSLYAYCQHGVADGPECSVLPTQNLSDDFSFAHSLLADTQNLRKMGAKLYDFLFPPKILSLYKKAAARLGDDHLTVQLIWQHSGEETQQVDWELGAMPWECCYDGENFIFIDFPQISLIRTSDDTEDETEAKTLPQMPEKFRLLMVTASPADIQELRVDAEGNQLRQLLDERISKGELELRIEKQVTYDRLKKALHEFQPHILHLSGHGDIEDGEGAFMLCEEGSDTYMPLTASQLNTLMRNQLDELPYFVLLNACKTAASGVDALTALHDNSAEPLIGMAPFLARQGVCAVLGMQFKIPDTAALYLMTQFYTEYLQGISIAEAVTKIRQDLYSRPDNRKGVWLVPSLFINSSYANTGFAPRNLVTTKEAPEQVKRHQAFLRFNYTDQIKRFKPVLYQSKKVGAFLFSDSNEDEVHWLTHRLVSHLPNRQQKKKVDISVSQSLHDTFDIGHIWREVGSQIANKNTESQFKIKSVLNKTLQTQNVLIILRDIAFEDTAFAAEVLKNFWHPLIKDIPDHAPFWLIFIMTDSENHLEPDDIGSHLLETEHAGEAALSGPISPNKLVHLNQLKPADFNEIDTLLDSLNNVHEELDDILQSERLAFAQYLEGTQVVETTISQTEVVKKIQPTNVFHEICAVCGDDYEWHKERTKNL